jgi:hypothetical protein
MRSFTMEDRNPDANIDIDLIAQLEMEESISMLVTIFGWATTATTMVALSIRAADISSFVDIPTRRGFREISPSTSRPTTTHRM